MSAAWRRSSAWPTRRCTTRRGRGGTAWSRKGLLHAEGLFAAPPAVGHAVVVFGHHLYPLLAAPSRTAAPRLFHRHQKSERRILELEMTKHVPMLAHVGLQELQNVSEADDAARGNGGSGRKGAEGDQSHRVRRLNLCGAVLQQVVDDAIGIANLSETIDHGLQNLGVPNTGIDAHASFLDLADDHVYLIRRHGQTRIESGHVQAFGHPPAVLGHRLARWKAEGQDVDVGDRAEAGPARASDDRIFSGGEVPVEL